ncbi:lipoyl(octanoyl) transferase LipB [Mucisphaera calidilacus]|uniref:Octanoyltransferase n=1 Tax=Mucisphaera calidilacus TaxID=2527982 RepID=A0A518BUK6_9BACT|nr:lipoyl(octanoyl) transferase LipB [Mucisphaera calidilacus]QDU70670.1 Octanoyltransferase [Mucisphaera calidilacus]
MRDSSVTAERFGVEDLGVMAYAEALGVQREVHAGVVAGERERLLVVEHPAVITLPDRDAVRAHILADSEALGRAGVDVQITDRGGDVTYHGPGQLVVYPIVRLRDHRLNLGRYMRLLEAVVMDTLAAFGVVGHRREGATGVWVEGEGEPVSKVCALGVRIRKNVTMHGLALNVTTDLRHFELIVPCGLADRGVTSLERLLGEGVPAMAEVVSELVSAFDRRLAEAEARA